MRVAKWLLAAWCLVVGCAPTLSAQTQVRGFVAPGVRHDTGEPTVEMGGSVDRAGYRGFGVGVSVGWMKARKSKGWAPVVRLQVSHAWRADESRIAPFVAVGLSWAPLFDTPFGVTLGAGLNAWVRDHVAVHLAFRDDLFLGRRPHQYYGAPIGVIWTTANPGALK
jgi:hypothetical protein